MVLVAVVMYAPAASEAGTRSDRRTAGHPSMSKATGAFAVARNNVIREMTVWERKVIHFVNRMVRMYEGSPYSYENFKKASDDLGKASKIK